MSDRAWRLFEWTWKLLVAVALAVGLGLASAQVPSLDDAFRAILASIPAFLVGKTINPRE